jgi:hypothetical protein
LNFQSGITIQPVLFVEKPADDRKMGPEVPGKIFRSGFLNLYEITTGHV